MKKIYFTLIIISSLLILSTCVFVGDSTVTVSPVIKAIGIPTNITFVELTVSGPGMNTIVIVYDSLPSSIELSIPSGSDRMFELVVYVDDPMSAATSFKGTAIADLSQGNAEITLSMGLNSTKLVIPDNDNNRLVQIDDMSGSGWKEIINSDIGCPINIDPNDVDFDSQGRIYIAIDTASSTDPFIIRIDNLDAVTYTTIIMGKATPCVALTADRKNGYLYYATSMELYRCNFDGTNDTNLTTAGIAAIQGLAVDQNGYLYIADYAGNNIIKYDPINQITVETSTSTNLNAPWDILVKDDYIYVANYAGADDFKIIRFDQNLGSELGFGKAAVDYLDTAPNHFQGPHRFIAILNKKFYLIDEEESSPLGQEDVEKIVAFDDELSSSWEAFDPSSIGQTAFGFYHWC